MESSVHFLSPPNTYSYVQNLGSTTKFVENFLLFLCITNKISALYKQNVGWTKLSKAAEKSSSSPCIASVCLRLSVSLSVIPNNVDFNVGNKIRVSTWSHLSVVCPPTKCLFLCARRIFGFNKKNV